MTRETNIFEHAMIDIIVTSYFNYQNLQLLVPKIISEQQFNALIIVEASNDQNEFKKIVGLIDNLGLTNIVKFVQGTRTLSAGEARNLGVAHSSSKFVAFLDADDEWEKDRLKNLEPIIEKYDVVVGSYIAVNSDGLIKKRLANKSQLVIQDHLCGQTFCASSIIVEREIVKTIKFWRHRREDFEWMLRILNAGHEVYYDTTASVTWHYKSRSNHIIRKLPRMVDQFRVYRTYYSVRKSIYYWTRYFFRALIKWL